MGEKTEAQPPDGAENEENTRSGRRNKRPGASRDRPCRRRNVSGQRRAAPKKRPFSFGMSCSMRPAPREGRRRAAQRRDRFGGADGAPKRHFVTADGGENRPGIGCGLRPGGNCKAPGAWTAAVGGGRLSVGVGRKRPLGHPLRLVQRMDAAASIRRSPSEKMRRKELAGRQREGERGCRSGKAAFCLLLPAILVYRYTGILVKRGEAVFLNKSRGGFLLILNRRRENGRISGRQTGAVGACAAAFCFMRPFRAETLRTVFQAFRSENRFVFQQTLSNLSLRGGHFQCPTRQSLTERDGIPERGAAGLRREIRPLTV